MIADAEKECSTLLKTKDEAQIQMEQKLEQMQTFQAQYNQLISWSELYDSSTIEAKKMIVNRLIHRVDVGRGYQVNIEFNFDYRQFMCGLGIYESA